MAIEFYCSKCGKCCEVAGFWNPELDDGTGACTFYNWETKLCSDYDNRPFNCNTSKVYPQMVKDGFFKNLEEAAVIHESTCHELEKMVGKRLDFLEVLKILGLSYGF